MEVILGLPGALVFLWVFYLLPKSELLTWFILAAAVYLFGIAFRWWRD
jgi:hypothetical protein